MTKQTTAAPAVVEFCESFEHGYWRCLVKLPNIGLYFHTVRARTPTEAERRVRQRIADRDKALAFGPYRGRKEKPTLKQLAKERDDDDE